MRNSRTFWGAAILIVGVLLLFQNLGIINVNIWAVLWPLLIILLGIQILVGIFFRGSTAEKKELSIPLSGSNDAVITFEHGAGQINLNGGVQPGTLLSGEFFGGVRESLNQSGTTTHLVLKVPDDVFFFWPMGSINSRTWNVKVSPEIPLDLHLKTGASESKLDLTDLLIRNLRIDTGASSTQINAPSHAGYTRMDLHSGAASIIVTIPQGVAAKIDSKGGLSSNNIDRTRFPQNGNLYESPDYSTSTNRIDIKVETGIGSVEIR